MYTLDLICINGHPFEGWFSNRTAFEKQRDGKLVICPVCSETGVQQAISPVRIKKHAEVAEKTDIAVEKTAPKKQVSKNILQFIEKNFDDVGSKFADEAIRIHLGETEQRNIRGTATADEEKSLAEEGVSFFKLPNFQ